MSALQTHEEVFKVWEQATKDFQLVLDLKNIVSKEHASSYLYNAWLIVTIFPCSYYGFGRSISIHDFVLWYKHSASPPGILFQRNMMYLDVHYVMICTDGVVVVPYPWGKTMTQSGIQIYVNCKRDPFEEFLLKLPDELAYAYDAYSQIDRSPGAPFPVNCDHWSVIKGSTSFPIW